MPITLGSHYISKSAARKLLVSFNRTIKGTKDEPRTIRGISSMDAQKLEKAFDGFTFKKGIGKNKGKEILIHKRVKSKSYSEVIPKDTKRKKGTKDAPSITDAGTEDYTGKKGQIKKSAGKDVKSENSQVDYEPSTQPAKKKKKRSAKQLANDKRLGEMARARAKAKKNKK